MQHAIACNGESSFISLCAISLHMRIPDPPLGVLLLLTSGSLETSEYCLLQNWQHFEILALEDRMQRAGKIA
jgi:hypothetical protein